MEPSILEDIIRAFSEKTPRPTDTQNFNYIAEHIAKTTTKEIQKHLLALKTHSITHYQHTLRVGVMFYDLAQHEELKLPDQTLALAGTVHDCGKNKIPLNVLEKPARLDGQEMKIMRSHNRIGYLHVKESEFPYLARIIIGHHKYPRGNMQRRHEYRRELELLEEEGDRTRQERRMEERRTIIQFIGRARMLLEMTDIYDALNDNQRAYKPPFSPEEVQRELATFFPDDSRLILYLMQNYPGPQKNAWKKP